MGRGPNKGELTCHPDGKNPGDVWAFQNVKHNHEEQTIHPAQFPEGLVARIALATVPPGGVMLDPYMGAGTVAVVARDHGLNFLGAEADPVYHQVAEHRLSGEPDPHDMFPNLKTLRAYVSRTGLPIEPFRFSVQIGRTASAGQTSHAEQHQIAQYGERLAAEEDAFEQRIRERA